MRFLNELSLAQQSSGMLQPAVVTVDQANIDKFEEEKKEASAKKIDPGAQKILRSAICKVTAKDFDWIMLGKCAVPSHEKFKLAPQPCEMVCGMKTGKCQWCSVFGGNTYDRVGLGYFQPIGKRNYCCKTGLPGCERAPELPDNYECTAMGSGVRHEDFVPLEALPYVETLVFRTYQFYMVCQVNRFGLVVCDKENAKDKR